MLARCLTAVLLALAVLGVSGCSAAQKLVASTDSAGASAEITVAVAGAPVDGALAKGVSADVPLWPGATVVASEVTDGATTITLEASDSYDDVLNGLALGFQNAKWQLTEEESGEAGARIAVLTVTGQGQEGVVTLSEEAGATTIDYLVTAAGK